MQFKMAILSKTLQLLQPQKQGKPSMDTTIRIAISSRSETIRGGYLAKYDPAPSHIGAYGPPTPFWQPRQQLHAIKADSAVAHS